MHPKTSTIILSILRQIDCSKTPIKVTKSLVQVSISREAVDYVFENLNVGPLIKQLELKVFGIDKLFWGTLNSNEIINLPGGFTRKYLEHKIPTYMITRYTIWEIDTKPRIPCESEFFRRWVCIFGVEDLPDITHLYNLYVNKLLSKFDFAAATCLLEHVYNNTYFPVGNHPLNVEQYAQLHHVKLHNKKMNI
ncbi:hypothetical protein FO519_010232 [Halicephalobus sp. NKZ332]|nr:hypothetical protein FO519_010232 [Halicephalobus sp. NKZ332]